MTFFGLNRDDLRMLLNLARLNVTDRYLGSRLGLAWAIVSPLLMFAVFAYVFGFVFRVRLPGASDSGSYLLWLVSGYSAWLATSEALVNSGNSLVSSSNLLKNLVFKTEIVPLAATLVGFIPLAVAVPVLLVGKLALSGTLNPWLVTLPLVMVVHLLMMWSVSHFLAVTTVIVRDFSVALPTFLTLMLFLTPILYPEEMIPARLRFLVLMNPVVMITSAYRTVLTGEGPPDFARLAFFAIASLVLLAFALAWYRRRKGLLIGLV